MFSITVILILATVAASFYAWNNESIYRKWILNPYQTRKYGEYMRLLTCGFIHADQMHLLFNMISFWQFGEALEGFFINRFGPEGMLIYVVFYLVAIVISSLPTYFKHKNNQWYNSLGASGAVSAVVFAIIIIAPTARIMFMPAIIYGALYLAYSYYASRNQADTINHDAHFYGALFGMLFIIMADPSRVGLFIYQLSTMF